MTTQRNLPVLLAILVVNACYLDATQEESAQNSTRPIKKAIIYNGIFIPKNWTEVSINKDKVTIRFVNGSTRTPQIEQLSLDHQLFLQRLQNGTFRWIEKLIGSMFG